MLVIRKIGLYKAMPTLCAIVMFTGCGGGNSEDAAGSVSTHSNTGTLQVSSNGSTASLNQAELTATTSVHSDTQIKTPTPTPTPAPVATAVFYVDAVAGNDNNDGRSPTTAWRTLDKVARESQNTSTRPNGFVAGNHILFRRGQTFASANRPIVKVAGTSSAPVVFDAWGEGAAPRLDNTGPNTYDVVLEISGNSALLQNLAVIKSVSTNKTQVGIHLDGSGHRITNSDFSGVGNGVRITGNNHRVDNSYFHDLTMVVADTTNPDNDYGATGILVSKASNIAIDHNRFERLHAASPDYGQDGSAIEFFEGANGVEVHHNVINDVVVMTEMGASASSEIIKAVKFHHNLVINANSIGVFHNSTSGSNFGATISDVRFEQNTFVKNTDNYGKSTGYSLLGFIQPPASGQFYFRNNVVDYRNFHKLFYNIGQMTHQSNVYSLTNGTFGTGFSLAAGEILDSAKFVSAASGDYRLSAGSIAIDRGIALGYTTDLNDLPAPVGTGTDIGAYEYR